MRRAYRLLAASEGGATFTAASHITHFRVARGLESFEIRLGLTDLLGGPGGKHPTLCGGLLHDLIGCSRHISILKGCSFCRAARARLPRLLFLGPCSHGQKLLDWPLAGRWEARFARGPVLGRQLGPWRGFGHDVALLRCILEGLHTWL